MAKIMSIAIAAMVFFACSSSQEANPEGLKSTVLGSFYATVNGATGVVVITPIVKNNQTTIKAQNHALLGWGQSIAQGGPVPGYYPLRPQNCTSTNATYNAPARTVSVQFSMKNVLSSSTSECSSSNPADTFYCPNGQSGWTPYLESKIKGPIELKLWDYYGDTSSACHDGSGRIAGIVDANSPTTCIGPLDRTDLININADFGCASNVSGNACFYSDGGFTYSLDASEYHTLHPGFDMGTLLNTVDSDFDLDPQETSDCKVIQFFFGTAGGLLGAGQPNNVPTFGFAFDVLGFIENYGSIQSVPVVTTPSFSTGYVTTNPMTLSVTLTDTAADRIRVTNGATETICIDNDVCDSNGASDAITTTISLNTNNLNRLYVHQSDGSNLSPGVMLNVTHDGTNPTVTATSPTNNATNVSVGINVYVSFSEAMDAASITTSTIQVTAGGGNLCTSVSLSSDGLIATCSHTSNFTASTVHTVTVVGSGSGVKDSAGNAMAANYTSTFTTGASDIIRPEVSSTSPPDDAADVPINVSPSVTFSEAMKSSTITNTNVKLYTGVQNACPPTSLIEKSSTVSLSFDQMTATLTPTTSFAANTEYTVSVNSNVQDAAGNTMQQSYCSTFVTSSTADSTAPSIVGSTPQSSANNIQETIRPEVFFSEPMDSSTLTSAHITLKKKTDQSSVTILTEVNSDNLTVRLVPTITLENNTTYVLTVLSSVKDLAGISMGAPWAIEFTTATLPDSVSPTVILVNPVQSSADNSVAPVIKLRFSEPMDESTIHTGTFTLYSVGNGPGCSAGYVNGSVHVSGDGLEALFDFPDVLCSRNQYTVTLMGGSSGAKDLAGNQLSASYTASFFTSKKNGAGPTVITASPTGSTGIGINSNVVVVFDQIIDPTTLTSSSAYIQTGTCGGSGTAVSSAIILSSIDPSVFALDPVSSLAANTTYQVNVTNAVKDKTTPTEAAIPFCATFTTGSSADSTRPSVVSTSPNDGGVNHPRYQSITVTFDEAIDPRTVGPSNVELVRTSDSQRIIATFSFSQDGKTLTINPSRLLDSNTNYYVNLKQSIRDVAGFALSSFYTFDFTTIDTSGDVTSPTVSQSRVYKGSAYVACTATGVGRKTNTTGQEIKIYLSEPIDPDVAITGIFNLIRNPGGSQTYVQLDSVTLTSQDSEGANPGQARSMIKMKTENKLSNGVTHQIQVTTDLVDDANNVLGATYSCNFST